MPLNNDFHLRENIWRLQLVKIRINIRIVHLQKERLLVRESMQFNLSAFKLSSYIKDRKFPSTFPPLKSCQLVRKSFINRNYTIWYWFVFYYLLAAHFPNFNLSIKFESCQSLQNKCFDWNAAFSTNCYFLNSSWIPFRKKQGRRLNGFAFTFVNRCGTGRRKRRHLCFGIVSIQFRFFRFFFVSGILNKYMYIGL